MTEPVKKSIRVKTIKAIYSSITVAEDAREWFRPDNPITNSAQVAGLFSYLQQETKEVFTSVHLDSKNRILCVETVAIGSLNAAIIHPRELFKTALLSNAAAIVLAHNHPSGDPTPSREDLDLTKRLQECGDLLGIRVLDHVIIGTSHHSLADHGQL